MPNLPTRSCTQHLVVPAERQSGTATGIITQTWPTAAQPFFRANQVPRIEYLIRSTRVPGPSLSKRVTKSVVGSTSAQPAPFFEPQNIGQPLTQSVWKFKLVFKRNVSVFFSWQPEPVVKFRITTNCFKFSSQTFSLCSNDQFGNSQL